MKTFNLILSAAIALTAISTLAAPNPPGLPEIVPLSSTTVATLERAIAAKSQSEDYRIQVVRSTLYIEAANLPDQDGYCGKVAKAYANPRTIEEVNKICMSVISDPDVIKAIANGELTIDEDGNPTNMPLGEVLSKALAAMIYFQAKI